MVRIYSQKIIIMKNHYGFYRDNLINDQVGFEPMFPKIHPHYVGWWSGHGKREVQAMILNK